ncbi:MAG: hypothetical protein NUW02_03000 [Candidatus Campbellbacteria bacterium]|nr:hypothetical protein [Candidatus Campbellbacteria bacterium]
MAHQNQMLCLHDGEKTQTPFSMEDGSWGVIEIECTLCGEWLIGRAVPFDPILEEAIAFCVLTEEMSNLLSSKRTPPLSVL